MAAESAEAKVKMSQAGLERLREEVSELNLGATPASMEMDDRLRQLLDGTLVGLQDNIRKLDVEIQSKFECVQSSQTFMSFAERLDKLEDSMERTNSRVSRSDDVMQLVEVLVMGSERSLKDACETKAFMAKTDVRLNLLEKSQPARVFDFGSSATTSDADARTASNGALTEEADLKVQLELENVEIFSPRPPQQLELHHVEISNSSWMSDSLKHELTNLDLSSAKTASPVKQETPVPGYGLSDPLSWSQTTQTKDALLPANELVGSGRAGSPLPSPVVVKRYRSSSLPDLDTSQRDVQLVTSKMVERQESPLLHATLDVPRSPRLESSVHVRTSALSRERQQVPFSYTSLPTRQASGISPALSHPCVEHRTLLERRTSAGSPVGHRQRHGPNTVQSERRLVIASPRTPADGHNIVKSARELLRPRAPSPGLLANGANATTVPVQLTARSGSLTVPPMSEVSSRGGSLKMRPQLSARAGSLTVPIASPVQSARRHASLTVPIGGGSTVPVGGGSMTLPMASSTAVSVVGSTLTAI